MNRRSRRKPSLDGPTDIGVVLERYLQQPLLKNALEQQKIFELWPQIIGEDMAKVVEIKGLNKGVLYLHVSSGAWKETINWQKKAILSKANSLLATADICEIRFV
jgi:hypothetical protein